MAPTLKNPALRTLLRPALAVRRRWLGRRQRQRVEVLESLVEHLAEDPVFELPAFRGRFAIGPRSDLFRRFALDGEYETEEARSCAEWIDPRRDAVDVGANVGFFTVLLATSLNAGRRVLSIEPTEGALERLRANLERNDVADRVVLFHGVASDSAGERTLNVIPGKEEYASLGAIVHPSVAGRRATSRTTSADTLDALVERFALDPGFVKVDVEGWEDAVFRGAAATLRAKRPVVLSELDDALLRQNGSSAESVLERFRRIDYLALDPTSRRPWRPDARAGSVLLTPAESAEPPDLRG